MDVRMERSDGDIDISRESEKDWNGWTDVHDVVRLWTFSAVEQGW